MNGFDGASSPAPSSSSSNSTLRPLQLQNTNKYLQNKSWVCTHCHFANDSLKIVCMNCRATKQHPTQQNGNQVADMSTVAKMHHSVQTKRKMMVATSSRAIQDSSTSKDSAVLNRSNEENECGPAEKSSKMVKTESTSTQYCKNCKGCEAANKTEKPQPMSNDQTNCMASLVSPTPQKPPSLFEMVIN